MEFKDKIKIHRENLGLTLEELAKKVGVSAPTIQRYESGEIANVRRDKISKLASALNVTPSYLMGWEDDLSNFKSSELEFIGKVENTRTYPYVQNPVAAGVPETIEGLNNLEKLPVHDYLLGKYAGNKSILMMRVNGESMNNIIPNNSLIAVYYNYPVENLKNGDIVVFSKDYDYSLKHFYDAGEKLIFKPNSSDISYTDIVCNKDESIQIIGKVIMNVKMFD